MIDILYTPSQAILVIICGSFQYLHYMKKQVKIEETFTAFVTADSLNSSLNWLFGSPQVEELYSNFYQFQLKLVKNCGLMVVNLQ